MRATSVTDLRLWRLRCMERCRPRLSHRHVETPRLLLVLVLVVALLLQANSASSDVVNLLRGGIFVDPSIKFALYPVRDVLATCLADLRLWRSRCMERCRPRVAHLHVETQRLLLVLLVALLLQADGASSDVVNLLRGGVFNDPSIKFALYPVRDVLAYGSRTLLPYWICVHGGVQLWDARVYPPAPSDSNCTFLLHMNSRVGGGHVVSAPLHTPRANAEYLVSLSVACNPHGGPRNQSLMALVYDDVGKEMAPRPEAIVVEADPASSMQNLTWQRRSFGMLGTGRPMYLYLVSLVTGYYGPLVANLQVTLVNLVENGSFETLSLDANDLFSNVTHDVVLDAPRLKSIPSWVVESGKIRLSITGNTSSLQAATDGSQYMIEMNAAGVAGEVSTVFSVPTNSTSKEFVLLFDAAVNPIQINPQTDAKSSATANVLVGKVGVKVVGLQTGKELLNKAFERNGTGFTPVSVGWTTQNFTFKMGEDKKAKVSFRSLAEGMDYGAFLDNVAVYEFKDKKDWIKVNAPGFVPPSCGVIHAVGVVERALQLLIVLLLLVFKQ